MPLHRNRLVAWIAAFAVTLQALWPLVAQAKPRIPGELVPICTVAGVTHYLELPAGKSPLDERSATHGEHCKLCVFGDGKGVAVTPLDTSVFLALEKTNQEIISRPIAFFEPAARSPAHPRAPPAAL